MDVLTKAMLYAISAHEGMYRKNNKTPYILHPMEAAAIVGSMTSDQEVMAAAVLHDVVEDTPVTLERLKSDFGDRIAYLVQSETENKREELPPNETWKIRKQEAIEDLQNTDDVYVKILYLGDKLSNMRSIYQEYSLKGEAIWQNFNQKDPEEQHWYYRSIADAISELSRFPAWQEYDRLIREIFKED